MTPKEKAEQLLNRFYFDTTLNELETSKECALIAVDEILQINWYHSEPECFDDLANEYKEKSFYWNEVKQEIEKL